MPQTQTISVVPEGFNYPANDTYIPTITSTTQILYKDQECVRPSMNNLVTSTGYRTMSREIMNKAVECYKENWGGFDECPVNDATINNAKIFLRYCENQLDWFPTVSVSSDGQFMLEWVGEKYISYISINQYGIIFLKTHKTIVNGDEDNKTISFLDKNDFELKSSLWKIFKAINDKDII